jgi:hypothetical protein
MQTGKKELSIIVAEAWIIALKLIAGQIFSNEDLDELGAKVTAVPMMIARSELSKW